ncbi:MAG TPA: hypothetical protein VK569_09040 [Bacteroidota bacterium]|nr:hypothetical protein [Bacteroidota bacterium]
MRIHMLVMTILGLSVSGCRSLGLESRWADRAGEAENAWRGALLPLNDRDASLSVLNDDKHLHVAFITTDPELQDRIMKQGLYIWFDPNGGEARRIGIRYPVAWSVAPVSADGTPQSEGGPSGSRVPGMGKPGDDLEIYTDGYKEYERMGRKDAGGIDVRLTTFSDTLLCQLSVPLGDNTRNPYALDAAPGDLVGVGVETRYSYPTGESVSAMLPFKAWIKVQLARHP